MQYVPDRSPGAQIPAELVTIREDITDSSWGLRINRQKTLAHVAALKQIYARRRGSQLDHNIEAEQAE